MWTVRTTIALGVTTASLVAAAGALAQRTPAPPPVQRSPNLCLPGSRSWCGDGGPATSAKLAGPVDVAVAADGGLLIADTLNRVVRRVDRDGIISTIAGNGLPGDAPRREATEESGFRAPHGVAAGARGTVLVADTGNDAIRKIGVTGVVSTLVGRRGELRAGLERPEDVVVAPDGALIVADTGRHRVLRAEFGRGVRVLAGTGRRGSGGDGGRATRARLRDPAQVSVTAEGGVLIADRGSRVVREVLPSGVITTVAGLAPGETARPGGLATTTDIGRPTGVAATPDGGFFVANATRVYRVDPSGLLTHVAGAGAAGFGGDSGTAATMALARVRQLALDPSGRLLLAERDSDRIRVLEASGVLATRAGSGRPVPETDELLGPPPAPPPGLDREADGSRARAAGARRSCSEGYVAVFAQLDVLPLGGRVEARRPLRLRFRTSRAAEVGVVVTRGGRRSFTGGWKRFRRGHGRVISVRGRPRRGRYEVTLFAKASGVPTLRCDRRKLLVR